MNHSQTYAFVLWGEGFEAVSAAIFVGELRRAGVRVKVVALNAQRTAGIYGLKLMPDITLDQALRLAERAICIVIPGDFEQVQQFSYDPRVAELFRRARTNNASVIVGRLPRATAAQDTRFSFPQMELIEFPAPTALFEFAENMANILVHVG